ncbi:MAG: phage tail sheath subtilisin-like domain-containing protein [Sphingomonas sp.]|nr:phage tail sheath subtilisin-like domain-containing protein [Sphingomonas sp.]
MTFFHGILVNEPVDGIRPILEKSTAVIGLVATASAAAGPVADAMNAAFPLNQPVLVTDPRRAVGMAGTGGTLVKALGAIADQGSPLVVVVRVAEQEDPEDQADAVIGSTAGGQYTGLQALLAAEARVGVRPRIIGVPGLDTLPVTTAAIVVARKLRGMVYAAARTGTAIAADIGVATGYRENFSARELMLIWPDLTGWDGQAIATALGLRAAIDEREGWHRSLSNIAFDGATAVSKDVHFDIRDASTDAGVLNAGMVTTIVRMNGFRFWGNRTTSEEAFFSFEVATRTAQAIQDAIADAEAVFIDKPMTVSLVRDIVETANATLRRWRTEGRLIGGQCWYDSALNPAESLAAGKLTIDYDYTPVAPMEGLTLNQRITARYYSGFGDALNGTTTA